MLHDPRPNVLQAVTNFIQAEMRDLPRPNDNLKAAIQYIEAGPQIADMLPSDDFIDTMHGLFTKKTQGTAAGHLNTSLFKKFNEVAAYYPYSSCHALIKKYGDDYGDMARQDAARGSAILLFELGSGMRSDKTREIIKRTRPDAYAVAEGDMSALLDTVEMVDNEFPDVKIYPRRKNFNEDYMEKGGVKIGQKEIEKWEDLPRDMPRLMVQFGSTLGNMGGSADGEMPWRAVLSALRNYRAHLAVGDHAVLSIDQNNEPESLHKCYSNTHHKLMSQELLSRVYRQVTHQGFNPDNFAFTKFWNPNNFLYGIGYEVLHDHSYMMAGEEVPWKQGEIITYANSYRYPQWFLDALYGPAGFELVRVNPDDKGYMHHQVLKAAMTPEYATYLAAKGHNHHLK